MRPATIEDCHAELDQVKRLEHEAEKSGETWKFSRLRARRADALNRLVELQTPNLFAGQPVTVTFGRASA